MDSSTERLTRQDQTESPPIKSFPLAFRSRLSPAWGRLDTWRRDHPRQAWTAFALAVLFLAGLYAWLSGGSSDSATTTVEVHRGDVEDSVTALGTLQPFNYVDVGAQVSGQLRSLAVKVGDPVTKGQALAKIDAAVQTAKVAQSRAQLQNLQAQAKQRDADLVLARRQFVRQQNLMKDNATSQDAFDTSKAQLDVATAAVASATAQVEQASSQLKADEVTLGYSDIVAPIDGTVASIAAQVGQTLNANQSAPIILRIADLKTMTVWTQVSEADVPKLTLGMPVYFTTLGMTQKRWEGTLRQIMPTPTVTNNVVLYTALFDVDNSPGDLMTQMTAQVFFVRASAKDVIVVPIAALHAPKREKGKPDSPDGKPPKSPSRAVTVVRAGGGHEERAVTVGIVNRVSAEIRSGLEVGEKVLVNQKDPTKKRSAGQSGGGSNGRSGSGATAPGGMRGFR